MTARRQEYIGVFGDDSDDDILDLAAERALLRRRQDQEHKHNNLANTGARAMSSTRLQAAKQYYTTTSYQGVPTSDGRGYPVDKRAIPASSASGRPTSASSSYSDYGL